jgi:hypothetical protein
MEKEGKANLDGGLDSRHGAGVCMLMLEVKACGEAEDVPWW